jgi:hypothetical protein
MEVVEHDQQRRVHGDRAEERRKGVEEPELALFRVDRRRLRSPGKRSRSGGKRRCRSTA